MLVDYRFSCIYANVHFLTGLTLEAALNRTNEADFVSFLEIFNVASRLRDNTSGLMTWFDW